MPPDNQITAYKYNAQNLISEVQTTAERKITLFYDNRHNLIEALLPGGMKSSWEYDYRGRVVKSRNATGLENRFDYDILGRVVQSVSPDGNVFNLIRN